MSEQSGGVITLSAEYNPSETSVFGERNDSRVFTLDIDENTYKILRYQWTHQNHDREYCHTYVETGQDIEYGVEIEVPDDVILNSEFTVPLAENWAR